MMSVDLDRLYEEGSAILAETYGSRSIITVMFHWSLRQLERGEASGIEACSAMALIMGVRFPIENPSSALEGVTPAFREGINDPCSEALIAEWFGLDKESAQEAK